MLGDKPAVGRGDYAATTAPDRWPGVQDSLLDDRHQRRVGSLALQRVFNVTPSDIEICCGICHVVRVVEIYGRKRASCSQQTLKSFSTHLIRPNLDPWLLLSHRFYIPIDSTRDEGHQSADRTSLADTSASVGRAAAARSALSLPGTGPSGPAADGIYRSQSPSAIRPCPGPADKSVSKCIT